MTTAVPVSAAVLTTLSHVVDEHVQLTVPEHVGHLRAAVERRVEYSQSPLAAHGRVQDGRLYVRALGLYELVVVSDLHGYGLVAVDGG